MGIGQIFNVLLINPIFNVLLLFLFVFSSWGLPGSLGWAIIALTTFFRLLFNPFYKKQIDMAADMEEIRPQLEKLQKKYKKQSTKNATRTAKTVPRKRNQPNVGMFAGNSSISTHNCSV